MKRLALLPIVLSACLPNEGYQRAGMAPMTLPPADGRPQVVRRAPQDYSVARQMTRHGLEFRVTRLGRDLAYSDGALARKVAEAWCAGFNRAFPAAATGRFSVPNSWVFDGDCA